MTEWMFYPRADVPPTVVRGIVDVFEEASPRISSPDNTLSSNAVLEELRPGLERLGFRVESGKRREMKVSVPVLFGRNGKIEKYFDADAHNPEERFVLEVEAGRAVSNNQFLKDLFQAAMMVDVDYVAIAVRRVYQAGGATGKDFESVLTFFETLYTSKRLKLPLKGVLILGY